MQNRFHRVFNNCTSMVLLVIAMVELVSFSYISSVFAPTGQGWQKMQNNSISSANQTNTPSGSYPPGVQTFAACNLGKSQGQVNTEDIGSTDSGKTK